MNFFPSVLQNMERIFILKGGPGTGKSTLMKRVGWYFEEQGELVESIYCSSDPSSLDGVILRERKVAIVDGTAPHVVEPLAPGACEEYINLGIAWDREKLVPYREEILDLQKKIKKEFGEIYTILKESAKIHNRWAGIYAESLQKEKLDQVTESLERELFGNLIPVGKTGHEIKRFSAALSSEGMVHHTESLTEAVKYRYFLKGRPGNGKSYILGQLLEKARRYRTPIEVYYHPIQPAAVIMLILRELDVCIFDAASPWEVFPSRDGDVMVDLYASVINPGTEEENQQTISLLSREHAECIRDAESHFARVRHLHDALEEYYIHAVRFQEIEQLTQDIIIQIE